jgi:hypothetical protein
MTDGHAGADRRGSAVREVQGMLRRQRQVLTTFALAAALAAPAAAHAATLSMDVEADDIGTPSAPRAASVSIDFEAGGAPLGTLAVDLGPEFRLGGTASDPTCAPAQVAADVSACPRGSLVAGGALSMLAPLPPELDPLGELAGEPNFEDLNLAGFAAPGGRALTLLASGSSYSVRTVIPVTVSGNSFTLNLPPQITQIPSARFGELTLTVGKSDGTSNWVAMTGCRGSWPFSATAAGPGTPVSAATSVPCATAPGADDGDVPDASGDASSPDTTSSTSREALCGQAQAGVRCDLGNVAGKVSRPGWPKVTGILWIADNRGRKGKGSRLNDEMRGGNGSDRLSGLAGNDILWGNYHSAPNGPGQKDVLLGGPGRDWISTGGGTNTVDAGAGADTVYARSGHGTIDCGAGKDTVWLHRASAYKVRRCERRRSY